MRKFGIGGDPQIQAKMTNIHMLLDRLDQLGEDTKLCRQWLAKAREVFARKFLGFHLYSAYDLIWQALHRIRHLLCRICPPDDLLSLDVDIRESLVYISAPESRKKWETGLNEIEESLRFHVSGHKTDNHQHPLPLTDIRYNLEHLSMLTAEARDSHWRKVNLLRTRLVVTALFLCLFLLIVLIVVPLSGTGVDRKSILAIIVFGSLGGLVSALQTMESLKAQSSQFYIQRTLVGLKPIIGAANGLVIYFLLVSGLISINAIKIDSLIAYLAIAFVSGFSERFFLSKVEDISGGKKKEKEKPGN
jgi:hypothetical protein